MRRIDRHGAGGRRAHGGTLCLRGQLGRRRPFAFRRTAIERPRNRPPIPPPSSPTPSRSTPRSSSMKRGEAARFFYDVDGAGEAVADWPPEEVIRAAKVLFVDPFGIEGMIRAARIASAAGIPVVADFESVRTDQCFADLVALVNHLLVPVAWARQWTNRSSPGEAAESLWNRRAASGRGHLRRRGLLVRRRRRAAPRTSSAGVSRRRGRHDGLRRRVSWGVCRRPGRRPVRLAERIRLASAAAALKARRHGGQAGIPARTRRRHVFEGAPRMSLQRQ